MLREIKRLNAWEEKAVNLLKMSIRLGTVGKGICWELRKRMKFDPTTKCHMHKQDSILENKTHKILRDFELQTDYLIPVK